MSLWTENIKLCFYWDIYHYAFNSYVISISVIRLSCMFLTLTVHHAGVACEVSFSFSQI